MASRSRLLHQHHTSTSLPLLLLLLRQPPRIQNANHLLPIRSTPLALRPFTTTPRLPASGPASVSTKQPAQPSISVTMAAQQAEANRSGDILDYVGLVDGTLIMPRTGPKLPSLLSSPRRRAALEWRRLRTRVVQFVQSVVSAKLWVRPRVAVVRERGGATAFARDVYQAMNLGLAAGDLSGLREGALAAGLRRSLEGRIARREAGAGLVWRLEGWVEEPRLASWRFVVLPGPKGTPKDRQHGMVQAVVRLVSRQSLLKTVREPGRSRQVVRDAGGREVVGKEMMARWRAENTKTTTEYLVVQRLLKKGKMGGWQVWGTAEESSLEGLAEEEERLRVQYQQYKQRQQDRSMGV